MYRRLPFEAIVWTTGLLVLAFSDIKTGHYTICPLAYADITFCPGCGLGRSINLLFAGRIGESLQAHPLGILAALILATRVLTLSKQYLNDYGKNY